MWNRTVYVWDLSYRTDVQIHALGIKQSLLLTIIINSLMTATWALNCYCLSSEGEQERLCL